MNVAQLVSELRVDLTYNRFLKMIQLANEVDKQRDG